MISQLNSFIFSVTSFVVTYIWVWHYPGTKAVRFFISSEFSLTSCSAWTAAVTDWLGCKNSWWIIPDLSHQAHNMIFSDRALLLVRFLLGFFLIHPRFFLIEVWYNIHFLSPVTIRSRRGFWYWRESKDGYTLIRHWRFSSDNSWENHSISFDTSPIGKKKSSAGWVALLIVKNMSDATTVFSI